MTNDQRSPSARVIRPEQLDQLPASDPGAIGSRRDLQRLNLLMGHGRMMARLLKEHGEVHRMQHLIELGGGDGTFLLRVARRIAVRGVRVQAVLVDRQALVSVETRTAFAALGWELELATADIFEWLAQSQPAKGAAMVANLFLHHFNDEQLRALLNLVARKSEWFAACEPRRSALALTVSRLLGLIGCNSVTRHDAPASVRAGFTGRELSNLWPENVRWRIDEREAGLFSHVFCARRPQA